MSSGIKLEQDDNTFNIETSRILPKQSPPNGVIQRTMPSESSDGEKLPSYNNVDSMEMESLSDSDFPTSPEANPTASRTSREEKSAGKAGVKCDKMNPDYLKRRERNNIAVKKSRIKAKQKIEETQKRVDLLTKENDDLRGKVQLLSKELTVLRSLFANGGLTVPTTIEVNGNTASGTQIVTLVPAVINGSNSSQTTDNNQVNTQSE